MDEAAPLTPSSEFPDAPGPDHPPTWEELHALADMLERFGQRLLKVEDRQAKMAAHLHQAYGVRL